jgi:hypothetical protein
MAKGNSVPAPQVTSTQEQPQTLDITKMSVDELKAICYDQIVLLNKAQQNINIIQAELAKRLG